MVALALLLLVVHNCANNRQHELEGENIQLKDQLQKQKDGLIIHEKYRKHLKDSFSREIKKINEEKKILTKNNLNLKNKVVSLQSKLKKDKETIKNLSKKAIADTINKRYNVTSTTYTDNSVTVKDEVPNKIVSELTEKDELEKETKIKDEMLQNKDSIIEKQDKVIEIQTTENIEAEKTISMHENKDKTEAELMKNANKTIKQLKIKNAIKTIAIPLAIIGTLLIAK